MEKYISAEAAEERLNRLERESHHNSVLWPDHVEECREALREIEPADVVEVVRCKNCKHRPVVVNPSRPYGFGLAGPGSDPFSRDETCPYLCDDGYYNRMPDDDGFCNLGEVKDG